MPVLVVSLVVTVVSSVVEPVEPVEPVMVPADVEVPESLSEVVVGSVVSVADASVVALSSPLQPDRGAASIAAKIERLVKRVESAENVGRFMVSPRSPRANPRPVVCDGR